MAAFIRGMVHRTGLIFSPLYPLIPNELKSDAILAKEIKNGSTEKVKNLLEVHPELLNIPMECNGELPLHYAVKIGNQEVVKTLLSLHADPTQYDDQKLLPIDYAFLRKDPEMTNILLSKEYIEEMPWFVKEKISIENQKEDFLKKVAERPLTHDFFANLNEVTKNGYTPLQMAVISKDFNEALCLLSLGVDCHLKTPSGHSLLHLAVDYNDIKTLLLLLMHKSNPNELNDDGLSPLMLATLKGNLQAMQALIAYGADLHWKPENPSIPYSPYSLLEKIAQDKNPLKINSGEAWLCLTTVAYWLSVGCAQLDPTGYAQYLPPAIGVAGALTSLAFFGPRYDSLLTRIKWYTAFAALEFVPPINVSLQALRTWDIASRAIEAYKTSYRNFSVNPLNAIGNVTMSTLNAGSSTYLLFQNTLKTKQFFDRLSEYYRKTTFNQEYKCFSIEGREHPKALAKRVEIGEKLKLNYDKCYEHAKWLASEDGITIDLKKLNELKISFHPDNRETGNATLYVAMNKAIERLSKPIFSDEVLITGLLDDKPAKRVPQTNGQPAGKV